MILQEVYNVINLEAQRERMLWSTLGRVQGIYHKSRVKARVFQRRGKTNRDKSNIDFVVPVPWTWTVTEAIECFKQEPVLLRIWFRIPRRRANNSSLLGREYTMIEGILTIALLKRTMFLHCKADKETTRVATKHQGKVIAFAPNPVFIIPQDNNTQFWIEEEGIPLILFNCEDTHGRNGARCSFFAQGTEFPKVDLPERTHTLNALFFFEVTLQPNLRIRMWIGKRFQKGRRTHFLWQVNHTDERSNGIKRRLLRRSRRTEESVWDMTRDKNTLDTHINPGDRQIGKVNPPVSLCLLMWDLRTKQKTPLPFPR